MRLYFYISRAGGLGYLSKILVGAKNRNSKAGVTGLMSYNKGRYLQIIEGDDAQVALLIEKIKNDPRHSDLQTILDVQTNHRYFGDWGMKLVPLLSECREFQAFMLDADSLLEQLSPHKHALTEIFHRYHRYSYQKTKAPTKSWQSLVFSVNQWPNFNEVSPTPELLALCSALFNNEMSYNELIEGHYFESETELNNQLKELSQIECLITSNIDKKFPKVDRPDQDYIENIGHLGFIHKMRDFINNRLH